MIAGDIQGGSWLKRFGTFISDRAIYDNRDNDLVVNTDSMFRGLARQGARYVFDQGADVSHFNYFKNERTRARVSQWLTAKNVDALSDFRKLEEALVEPKPMKRGGDSRSAAARPAVVLVPDLMGSDLHAGDTRIWLNYAALSEGGFAKLADLGAGVETKSVLSEHYQELSDFLSRTHEVIPCAYDWRQSTADIGRVARRTIAGLLKQPARTVRIVAHGMGGLVVEQMARARADLWQELARRDGARVVLLGTPHAGTYEAVELLLGTHPIAQQLAMLDPKTGTARRHRDPAELPGHSRAPAEGCTGIHDSPGLAGVCRASVAAPTNRMRRSSRMRGPSRLRSNRARSPLDVVCNVAGTRAAHGLRRRTAGWPRRPQADDRRRRPRDASVGAREESRDVVRRCRAWRPRLRPANPRRHPGAARDRVHEAAPQRTAKREPGRRARQADGSRAGPLPDGTRPSCGRLRKDRTAISRRQVTRRARGSCVTVVHGDLSFARFPIVVGHYEADTIIGAEAVIDRLFDRRADDTLQPRVLPGAARHTRGRRPRAHTAAESVAAAAGSRRRRPRPLG